MLSPRRLCNHAGCNLLATNNGFCEKHLKNKYDIVKEDWKKKFYSSQKWRKKSLEHRRLEPFCRRCLPKKLLGNLVHHNPELSQLIEEGKDPLDDTYLETLCHNHHQVELNKRKKLL
jgi:hypothetical protein